MSDMQLSIVIPARNAATTIADQLDALSAQMDAPAFEVIVVDNGSTDATREVVQRYQDLFADLRIIEESTRSGVNVARNTGVRAARAPKVLICDADDVVTSSWTRSLGGALDGFDIVGGPLDEEFLNAGPTALVRTPLPTTRLPEAGGFLPYAVGCNMGFRRSVWERVGGFDETWAGGGDDVEFCWRAQLSGASIGLAPDGVVRYRYRAGERETVRQLRAFAEAQVRLYREFRGHGMPRIPTLRAVRSWAWLVVQLPDLKGSAGARASWLRRYAQRTGYLRGSVRYRVRYL